MRTPISALALAAAALVLFGCENSESEKGVSWNGAAQPAATPAASSQTASSQTASADSSASSAAPAAAAVGTSGSAAGDGSGVADAVPFSSLLWKFGGENGSRAAQSGVVISGLSCSKGGLSFRYVKNLSAWGRSNGQIADYACFFVQKTDGSWVGGKFDWISSSRSSRDFVNVYSGYAGWSLEGVPNPCNAAFVIVSGDCKRRSNVIAGTWSR